MNKEMQNLLYELKQVLVQHSPKWDTLCDIEQYIIDLEQENKELFVENMKLKDKLEQQRKEYQETYKDVREEIKELKRQNNILNEFEKWLEKYKKDEIFDYGNEQANNDFNEFCDIALDKLQELKKEGNNEKNKN